MRDIVKKYLVILMIAMAIVVATAGLTFTPQYKALRLLSYLQPHRDLAERLLLPGRRMYTTTVEPSTENGSSIGGVIVSLFPAGTPRNGIVLFPGTFPDATRNPEVLALAKGLAQDGAAVYVPGVASLFDAQITDSTLRQSEQAVQWFAQSHYVRGSRVSVVGICSGASMAILTAENVTSKPFVRAVVADDPYATLFDVLMATATGYGPDSQGFVQPFRMNSWTRWEVAHSAAYMINNKKSRNTFLQVLGSKPSQGDPFLGLETKAPPGGLSKSATAWWRLFANSSVSDFQSYYNGLPVTVRERLASISPMTDISQLSVPVYVIAPILDTDYPQQEVVKLQQGNPRVHVTLTSALNHVTPQLNSFGDFWTMLRFSTVVVQKIMQ